MECANYLLFRDCCSRYRFQPYDSVTLSTFKRHKKIHHLFQSVPLPSSHPVSAPQIRSHDFWRYVNLHVCMYVTIRFVQQIQSTFKCC